MDIRVLHRDKVDIKKWHHLIKNTTRISVFNFSWYLNALDYDWYVFVKGDYEWALPFFVDNKRVLMPFFLPYLSVCSASRLSLEEHQFIANYWKETFTEVQFCFGKYQFALEGNPDITKHRIYQKDLVNDYNIIAQKFAPDVYDKLESCIQNGLYCKTLHSLFEYVKFVKEHSHYKTEQLNIIRRIILKSKQFRAGKMYAVYSQHNELVGVCFITYIKNKAQLMQTCFSKEGLRQYADYLAMHSLIEELSVYNLSLENHCNRVSTSLLEKFGFKSYYSYQYRQSGKSKILSLLHQYLKL